MKLDSVPVPLILAVAVCLALPAPAADEPSAEPWSSMQRTLLGMRNSINAVSRVLDQDVKVAATAEKGRNWFEQCCAYNVRKINDGTSNLHTKFDYLEAQYASREELQAVVELNSVRAHLEEVQIIFNNMGNSTSKQDARDRLMAIIHPFTHAQRTLRTLETRYPLPPPPVESAGNESAQ